MLSALIGILIIVVIGAICFWAIEKFVRDGRLANLLKLLVVLMCLAAILQRLLPLAGIGYTVRRRPETWLMPLRRSAATKVMVFQCPSGTRPIRRSPRGQRPLSRTILVLAAVSSTKTSRAGSNMPCSRIQRRRARATSARSCSAACRLFFESNLVTLKEAPDRGAAASNLVLAHRQNHFVQCQVRLLLNQTQQKIRMLLQW